ncbi:MAG: lipoprotein-releasing ABC transporter permease subunit [Dissulfurispiraceae bacterium]|jgi:lipoprotein-releasing system permease protein|nr:lipoprotein-releasing ABC transporter permease subunit [Dissulfurispiraceae bacterium]
MKLPFPFFIAFRYLKSKKKHKGISLNTYISIGGVFVGVTALLVVLAVMSGFHEDLQKKILGANAHVVVLGSMGPVENYELLLQKLRTEKGVVSASPMVLGQIMLSSGKRAHGVVIRGIDLDSEKNTTEILKHIKAGRLDSLMSDDSVPWIILGRELASILGVMTGDSVNMISPTEEIGPLGMLPKIKQFRVAALFEVGMFEYDANLVLADLGVMQQFFGLGSRITGVELKLSDIYRASDVRELINKKYGADLYAKDWMQMNRNLFSALKLEKFAMFVILILIVLVASFNIVSTLMMNVIEKEKEIAILKTMGATNNSIMMIFMLQGLIIGVVGTLMGLAGGYGLSYILNNYELIKLPADVYYLSKLPVKVKLFDFVVVSISAVLISFLSTIYPSYQAARLNPVEPLRYE